MTDPAQLLGRLYDSCFSNQSSWVQGTSATAMAEKGSQMSSFAPLKATVHPKTTKKSALWSFPCSPSPPPRSKAFPFYTVRLDKEEAFSPVSKIPSYCPFEGSLFPSGVFVCKSLNENRDQWLHCAQDMIQGENSQSHFSPSWGYSSHTDAPQFMGNTVIEALEAEISKIH